MCVFVLIANSAHVNRRFYILTADEHTTYNNSC